MADKMKNDSPRGRHEDTVPENMPFAFAENGKAINAKGVLNDLCNERYSRLFSGI